MVVDNGVLVRDFPERKQLVIVSNSELGAIIPQVLDDLLVLWLFCRGIWSLEARETLMARQGVVLVSVVGIIGFILGVSAV